MTGLKQLIKHPTRCNNTIDLIYTNSDYVIASGIVSVNLSDHNMIYLTRKKSKEKSEIKTFYGRSYTNYNKIIFHDGLLK